ncbi:MAG: patatin-like phospholipase family protein [Hyphomonadaceae bacterium]
MSRKRTAFVFAGGGSLGAIQVGMLRELVAAGERPDMVVGASVGAINACFFAGRPDADGVEALAAIWRGLSRADIFPLSLRALLAWLAGRGTLFEPARLQQLLARHLPVERLEQAAIPVHVVATTLNGRAVRLSEGPAIPAVLASAAIPIAFPHVKHGDEYLLDGAIAGNTPLIDAAALGADRIIVLQTGYACTLDAPPRGALAQGLHAINLLIANQMNRDLALLAGKVEVAVAPALCPLDVSPLNFAHSHDLIERAAASTRAWIENGGLRECGPALKMVS